MYNSESKSFNNVAMFDWVDVDGPTLDSTRHDGQDLANSTPETL